MKKTTRLELLALLTALSATPEVKAEETEYPASVFAGTEARSGFFPSGFSFERSPTMILDMGVARNSVSVYGIQAFSRDNHLILAGAQADATAVLGSGFSTGAGLGAFLLPYNPLGPSTNAHGNLAFVGSLEARVDGIYDFGSGNGAYVGATVGRGYAVSPALNVRGEVHLGYNHHYFVQQTGLSHAEAHLMAAVQLGRFILEPHVRYSAALRTDFDNHLSAGLRLLVAGVLE